MLRELVVRLEGEPWLEIRLPPGAGSQPAEQRCGAIAAEVGYRGELRVLPDPTLGPGDARLAWQDGAAERDLARLEAEATALVDAWLPATRSRAMRRRRNRTRRHEWGDAMSDETRQARAATSSTRPRPAARPTQPRGRAAGRRCAAADRPPAAARQGDDLGAVYDIPVQLSAVLGKATMPVSQLLRLGRGAVVELDRKVGESIDILVNNRLVARGEVVIVDDRLGVTMTEIIKTDT